MHREVGHPGSPWNAVWAGHRYGRSKRRASRAGLKAALVSELAAIQVNDVVLDIGCGDGTLLRYLLQANIGMYALGIDSSPPAIERASAAEPWADFIIGDATSLPLRDASVNVIVAVGSLEHIYNFEQAMREVVRVARRGARVVFITSNSRSVLHWERLARERLHLWPYGFQRNWSPQQFRREAEASGLAVTRMMTLHASFDYLLAAVGDRLIARVLPLWGRYIVIGCNVP